jgi:hypothetical protein
LVQQRYDGCVYVLGYAAEMWLKAVCLTLRNHPPTAPVLPALPVLRAWMKLTAPQVPFTNYHDLAYLAQCVVELRAAQGRPLSMPLQGELQARITRGLHEGWIVDMRYRRLGLPASEAWAALDNAWWLRRYWVHLL